MAVERQLPGWGFWGRWVLVSAVGFGLGAFLGMCLAWATVGVVATGAVFAPGGELIYWAVAIALGGMMQWLVLRGHVKWARWWALPVPTAIGLIGLIALTDPDPPYVGGGFTHIAFHAKDIGLAGTFYGAIVGVPLVWFLRRSYRKSSRAGNASL